MANRALLLIGPTATGKTDLVIRLAKVIPIEVISVDSAQIYQDMNIGSAKPTSDVLSALPHHLINIISPLERYSLAEFVNDSVKLIGQINQRGKLPVLVGGTMLYFNGLLKGIAKLPEANAQIRLEIEQRAAKLGLVTLHRELFTIDQVAAAKIMPSDSVRIIRALEVFYLTGMPISQLQQHNDNNLTKDIDFIPLAIIPSNRALLHQRIEARFYAMLKSGFVQEVEELKNKYPGLSTKHTSMRCVGYYQAWRYLVHEISYDEFINQALAATRQLAKRQITWLKQLPIINIATDSIAENVEDEEKCLDQEYLYSSLVAKLRCEYNL